MPLISIVHHHHHHTHYHRHDYSQELEAMNAQLAALRQQVAENTAVDQSAITLITGLVARINELVANTSELEELRAGLTELTNDLDRDNDALAAAVAANTPGQPADPVTPVDPAPGEGGETPAPVEGEQPTP